MTGPCKHCIVLLGNDVHDERLFPQLVRAVLGEIVVPWRCD